MWQSKGVWREIYTHREERDTEREGRRGKERPSRACVHVDTDIDTRICEAAAAEEKKSKITIRDKATN